MLANTELAEDFTILNQQYRKLVQDCLDAIGMSGVSIRVEGRFRDYDPSKYYVVSSGHLEVRIQDRTIYRLERGEMLLPTPSSGLPGEQALSYSSDSGALLESYPRAEWLRRVSGEAAATRLWTRLLEAHCGLLFGIAIVESPEPDETTPDFEVYDPGDTIIRQGDAATSVYNMTSGSAEVLVDGVTVGHIGEGEIFGAMAALTGGERSATVKATTECAVARVPREHFTELIRKNPAVIHDLLVDMAHSIVRMNQQLVDLHGSHRVD